MQDMRSHVFRNLGAFGIDPDMNQTYRRLAPENTIWREIGRRRRPLTDTMVMPKAAFLGTELYADWFRPQNFYSVMAFPTLFRESHSAVVVAFRNRSLGDFEAADLARLGSFAKHFGRALGVHLDREQSEEQLAAANLLLDEIEDAVLLVDRNLLLRHANAAARAMLETGGAIRSQNGRLELHDPRTQAKLAQMAAGARGGELRLSGSGSKGLIVQLHACAHGFGMIGTGAMTVRIVDPGGRCERPNSGQTARSPGRDAAPSGGDRRASKRRDGKGCSREARPPGTDPAHACPARLRQARPAQSGRACGPSRPPWF